MPKEIPNSIAIVLSGIFWIRRAKTSFSRGVNPKLSSLFAFSACSRAGVYSGMSATLKPSVQSSEKSFFCKYGIKRKQIEQSARTIINADVNCPKP